MYLEIICTIDAFAVIVLSAFVSQLSKSTSSKSEILISIQTRCTTLLPVVMIVRSTIGIAERQRNLCWSEKTILTGEIVLECTNLLFQRFYLTIQGMECAL